MQVKLSEPFMTKYVTMGKIKYAGKNALLLTTPWFKRVHFKNWGIPKDSNEGRVSFFFKLNGEEIPESEMSYFVENVLKLLEEKLKKEAVDTKIAFIGSKRGRDDDGFSVDVPEDMSAADVEAHTKGIFKPLVQTNESYASSFISDVQVRVNKSGKSNKMEPSKCKFYDDNMEPLSLRDAMEKIEMGKDKIQARALVEFSAVTYKKPNEKSGCSINAKSQLLMVQLRSVESEEDEQVQLDPSEVFM